MQESLELENQQKLLVLELALKLADINEVSDEVGEQHNEGQLYVGDDGPKNISFKNDKVVWRRSVGDVFIMVDPNGPRNFWPKGIVTNIHPTKDKEIRIVGVTNSSGTIFRRPISRFTV
ncbi:hypothetical protein JTB14_037679 [Gonioctena quinquepunctata]|nr:hypothetical protein JTB14_037679 [Gonioctena quinquepunctata]